MWLISVGVRSVGGGGFQLREDQVVDGFFGEAGEASGLVDVTLGGRDCRVTESVLDVAHVDRVGGKRDCREGVSERVRRVIGQADCVESFAYDPRHRTWSECGRGRMPVPINGGCIAVRRSDRASVLLTSNAITLIRCVDRMPGCAFTGR